MPGFFARTKIHARRFGVLACVLLLGAPTPLAAACRPPVTVEGLADLPALQPVMGCADVSSLDLRGAADAPVTIQSATVVTTGTPAPYCEVRATVAPADTIVVRLPVARAATTEQKTRGTT